MLKHFWFGPEALFRGVCFRRDMDPWKVVSRVRNTQFIGPHCHDASGCLLLQFRVLLQCCYLGLLMQLKLQIRPPRHWIIQVYSGVCELQNSMLSSETIIPAS